MFNLKLLSRIDIGYSNLTLNYFEYQDCEYVSQLSIRLHLFITHNKNFVENFFYWNYRVDKTLTRQ